MSPLRLPRPAGLLPDMKRLVGTPDGMRRFLSVWPPYLAARVRVDRITPDWRVAEVSMGLSPVNANYMGTQFGGSLYSMSDPFWVLLLVHILGPDYHVWDAAAEIRFVSPGRGRVHTRFEITPGFEAELREAAASGEKVLRWVESEVRDERGELVATVRKQLYVRLVREKRPAR